MVHGEVNSNLEAVIYSVKVHREVNSEALEGGPQYHLSLISSVYGAWGSQQ